MTAAEIASFALVVLGWQLWRAVSRWSSTRDPHHVSPEYLRNLARGGDRESEE